MPPFVKGNTLGKRGRPSGVVKGVVRFSAVEACEKTGFNPFMKLIELATEAKSSLVQFNATAELASYLAPKLKQIEFKGDQTSPVVLNFNMVPKMNDS